MPPRTSSKSLDVWRNILLSYTPGSYVCYLLWWLFGPISIDGQVAWLIFAPLTIPYILMMSIMADVPSPALIQALAIVAYVVCFVALICWYLLLRRKRHARA